MSKGTVGAGIVSIITESLYDKPIVVFREYIQNAVDALDIANSIENCGDFSAQIWMTDNSLFFLDNGTGIDSDRFQRTMESIADSGKKKTENLGYKGIGRLSGIPYCSELSFINIIDYSKRSFQEYTIDCNEYREIQRSDSYYDLDFDALMLRIGKLVENPNKDHILNATYEHSDLFTKRNTGFLVVLKDITSVLRSIIDDEQFPTDLGWLLPVPFLPELVTPSAENGQNYELFAELMNSNTFDKDTSIPARPFRIFYNKEQIYRPLKNNMFRTYLCKSTLEQYAVCVHTFSNKKIEIDRKNPFSGIRIYIDNILLCDENELIPALQQYGLIRQSTYEMIQSVRGIGAMIYIVDKINISANARRTFIDVTDEDSFNFLALIGEFVDNIFKARYALSGYDSAKRKEDTDKEKLDNLRQNAQQSLENLARSDITLEAEEKPEPIEFNFLPKAEQKRIVKNIITKGLNSHLKKYLSQIDEYNPDTCFNDFKIWLSAN